MPSLDDYLVLGFDYRIFSSQAVPTVDELLWAQAEDVYAEMLASGCRENGYQLLDCDIAAVEEKVQSDTVAIAIAVSPPGYSVMQRLFGQQTNNFQYSTKQLLARNWEFRGFDVADANGFFSVFGIDSSAPKLPIGPNLFATELEAEALLGTASALYPSHAPFAIFAVFSYSAAEIRTEQ